MPERRHVGRKAGFSLVELLVVVAIIAIISSILLPALGRANNVANATKCRNNLMEIGKAIRFYMNAHRGFMPIADMGGVTYPGDPRGDAAMYGGHGQPEILTTFYKSDGQIYTYGGGANWKTELNWYLTNTTPGQFEHAAGETQPRWDSYPAPRLAYARLQGDRHGGAMHLGWESALVAVPGSPGQPQYPDYAHCLVRPINLDPIDARVLPIASADNDSRRYPPYEFTYPGMSPVWLDPTLGSGKGQYTANSNVISIYEGVGYRTLDSFRDESIVPVVAECYAAGQSFVQRLQWPLVEVPGNCRTILDYRHLGKAHVLFLDGHVEALDKDNTDILRLWTTVAMEW